MLKSGLIVVKINFLLMNFLINILHTLVSKILI